MFCVEGLGSFDNYILFLAQVAWRKSLVLIVFLQVCMCVQAVFSESFKMFSNS